MDTYMIKRFYCPDGRGNSKPARTIKQGLTLEQAQEHCNDDSTKCSAFFDGYEKE